MKNKKLIVTMWALILLPVLLYLILWQRLPEQLPMHWGNDGSVRFDPKTSVLWTLALGPFIGLLIMVLPKIDPKRANYGKFQKYYDWVGPLVALVLLFCHLLTLSEALWPGRLAVGRIAAALIAVLFLVLGNFMGKIKPNWFMGFRTPWALEDPDNWNKTQRMGGWVFVLTGLAVLPCALLAPETVTLAILLAGLLTGCVVTYLLSYYWHRQKQG